MDSTLTRKDRSRLAGAIVAATDRFADRLLAWNRTVPGYREIPVDVLRASYLDDDNVAVFDDLVRRVFVDRRLPAGIGEWATQVAKNRSALGVSVEAQMRAVHAASEVLLGIAFEEAAAVGWSAADMAESRALLFEWADRVAAAVAEEAGRIDAARRERALHAVLIGPATGDDLASAIRLLELDPEVEYVAVRAGGYADGALARVEHLLTRAAASRGETLAATRIGGDLAAVMRPGAAVEAGDAAIAVGSPEIPALLCRSFGQASRALATAEALGLEGCVSLADLNAFPAVVGDDEVGDLLVARYLEPLTSMGGFGTVLADTLRAFLDHGLRIEETARKLFVHPNTLRNRLRRYEEITGADLHRMEDLVGIWWALQRTALSPRTVRPPRR